MFDALTIAQYAINKCMKDDCPISNLQLQNILFYIQKLFLTHDQVAFYDRIEAWQFGPVVPSVYYRFCGFGAMPISMPYDTNIDGATTGIDSIIEEKRKLDPWDMVADTHREDGAWYKVYNGGKGCNNEITRELICQLG